MIQYNFISNNIKIVVFCLEYPIFSLPETHQCSSSHIILAIYQAASGAVAPENKTGRKVSFWCEIFATDVIHLAY